MLAALHAHSRAMFGMAGPDEAEASTRGAATSPTSSVSLAPAFPDQDEDDSRQSDDGWGADQELISGSEDDLDRMRGEQPPCPGS